MISKDQTVMYSEVYQILNMLGKEYIEKIPIKLYDFIKSAKDESYSPNYSLDIPLEEQAISKKTIVFICMLHYNYWCKNEEEKKKIDNILAESEKQMYAKNEYDFFKKNNTNNMQEKSIENVENGVNDTENKLNSVENKSLVKVEKKGIWAKIISFFQKHIRKNK